MHFSPFWLVRVLSEGLAPVDTFRRISEVIFRRADRLAVSGQQFGVGRVILLSVSILDVADSARQTLNEGCDTVVAFTARAGWPVYGRACANF